MGARNVFAEAVSLLLKHEWEPHDESRDYCIECGGARPEPGDMVPMGHVKGCALVATLRAAGHGPFMESGVLT